MHYDEQTHRLLLVMGDVMGHGMNSALITVSASGSLHSAFTMSMSGKESLKKSIELVAHALGASLQAVCGKLQRHLTCAFVMIDCDSGRGAYVNAGHNPVYLRQENELSVLLNPSTPIGLEVNQSFVAQEFQMQSGDGLFMYTDGLFENSGVNGARLSKKSIRSVLKTYRDPEKVRSEIIRMSRQSWNGPIEDDWAFFVFEWYEDVNKQLDTIKKLS